MNPERLGVTTSAKNVYARSSFDKRMEKEFNPVYRQHGPPKPFRYEAYNPIREKFSFRTSFDKNMQKEFNTEYQQSAKVREDYRTHSHLYDDPSQPYSYRSLQ